MTTAKIPTIVLGGTGYVAGELLRLIAGHPNFELAAIMSDSQPGAAVGQAFPHLAAVYGDMYAVAPSPSVEAMFTTRPSRCRARSARHDRISRTCAVRFTAMIRP